MVLTTREATHTCPPSGGGSRLAASLYRQPYTPDHAVSMYDVPVHNLQIISSFQGMRRTGMVRRAERTREQLSAVSLYPPGRLNGAGAASLQLIPSRVQDKVPSNSSTAFVWTGIGTTCEATTVWGDEGTPIQGSRLLPSSQNARLPSRTDRAAETARISPCSVRHSPAVRAQRRAGGAGGGANDGARMGRLHSANSVCQLSRFTSQPSNTKACEKLCRAIPHHTVPCRTEHKA